MAKQRIFYVTTDNGDGSSSVRFMTNMDRYKELEDHDPETYGGNDGRASYFDVDGPHTIPLDEITDEDFIEY